jgi:hypothetical protein
VGARHADRDRVVIFRWKSHYTETSARPATLASCVQGADTPTRPHALPLFRARQIDGRDQRSNDGLTFEQHQKDPSMTPTPLRSFARTVAAFALLTSLVAAGCGGSENKAPITVKLTSIALTPVNPSIAVGGTQQFTATGTFSDQSKKDISSMARREGDHLQRGRLARARDGGRHG